MYFLGYPLKILKKSVTIPNPWGMWEKTKSPEPPGESGRVGNYVFLLVYSKICASLYIWIYFIHWLLFHLREAGQNYGINHFYWNVSQIVKKIFRFFYRKGSTWVIQISTKIWWWSRAIAIYIIQLAILSERFDNSSNTFGPVFPFIPLEPFSGGMKRESWPEMDKSLLPNHMRYMCISG